MAKKPEKNQASFEDDFHQLEEIVEKLESGAPVEESIELYQTGIQLVTKLEKRLADIERKVYEVKNVTRLAEGEDDKPELVLFQ